MSSLPALRTTRSITQKLLRPHQKIFTNTTTTTKQYQSYRSFSQSTSKMVVHVINSTEDFKKAIAEHPIVALDAWATWCGPCRVISPIFDKLSEVTPHIYFVKVDVDDVPELSQELNIRAMPTFQFYHNGEKAKEVVGANPPALHAAIASFAPKTEA